ncbi:hypothetical protein KF707C_29300 [Metapseudomonas furukawaii]|uniref:Uncharacterized protein n=1 Tax=Metapseudomonas furukawaii TaxID=1149133 RepID=A0AAD1C0B2_METFU|nr:hypothetical protein KF707C_29300 [Pseudomonas furukawaii]
MPCLTPSRPLWALEIEARKMKHYYIPKPDPTCPCPLSIPHASMPSMPCAGW